MDGPCDPTMFEGIGCIDMSNSEGMIGQIRASYSLCGHSYHPSSNSTPPPVYNPIPSRKKNFLFYFS